MLQSVCCTKDEGRWTIFPVFFFSFIIRLYTIFFSYATQSVSIWWLCRAIKQSDCYHREGQNAACSYGDSFYMLLFGVVQIVFSQIPDFHEMAWLSIFAAIMSFSYSFIGFALGLAKMIGIPFFILFSSFIYVYFMIYSKNTLLWG